MASYSQRTVVNKNGKETIKWRVLFFDATGKRKEFNGKSKREVTAKMDAWNEEIAKFGNIPNKDQYTVAEWIEKHLFVNKHGKVAHSTFQSYKTILDKHIKWSDLGKMNLKDVRQIDIQEFLNANDTLSYSTLKKFYITLSQACESACKNALIRKNPCNGVTIPNKSSESKEIQILSLSQQEAYVQALKGETHELLLLTGMFTGMRLGELLALRWEFVDLDEEIIYVCESIKRVKVFDKEGNGTNQLITKAPKSKSGIRTIPIPLFLVEMLKNIKPKTGDLTDYVFLTKNGNPHTARNVQKYHSRICSKAKINPVKTSNGIEYKGVSFHALRHTYATRMLENGESIKVVQDILGHKDAQTTLNIYAHSLKETKKASADKQNALFIQISQNLATL